MSTEQLSREQACDKFIAQKMRDGAGGLNRMISRAAFEAGWSARDAEVERLRAACEVVSKGIDDTLEATPYVNTAGLLVQFKIQLQAALNPTEPSDA